jgi:nucleoid DNA-binding protein
MTKADIVSIIREKISPKHNFEKREISLKVISTVLDALFVVLKENIANGEHIELRGFGTFETKIREPKKAINPRTKEVVDVKRHAVPIFRAGKELKAIVRESFDKKLNKDD